MLDDTANVTLINCYSQRSYYVALPRGGRIKCCTQSVCPFVTCLRFSQNRKCQCQCQHKFIAQFHATHLNCAQSMH